MVRFQISEGTQSTSLLFFVTLSLSLEAFLKRPSNANKAHAEFKSDGTAVVSLVNCKNFVSKPSKVIPVVFS